MNSISFNKPAIQGVPAGWEPLLTTAVGMGNAEASSSDSFQALSRLRVSGTGAAKPKQRFLSIGAALLLQTAFACALIFGSGVIFTPRPEPLTIVQILPETRQEKPIEPPLPHLVTPELSVKLPPMPEIVAPPPVVTAPPPVTAITTSDSKDVVVSPPTVLEPFPVRMSRYIKAHLRYPPSSHAKHEQGVVYVRFTMDRSGRVLSAVLEKRSRFAALNDEALALIQRAQPLPVLPPEVEGNTLEMVIPVEFSLR